MNLRPAEPTVPTPWLPAVVALVVGFGWRMLLVSQTPTAFAYDGFQRWAGRDHLLIQDWLPAAQLWVWAVAQLGGGLVEGRAAMALVSAVAAAMGTLLAQRLAAPRFGEARAVWAGWAFVAASTTPAWTSWGTVFYQESTFLLFLFAAFWAGAAGHLRLGDVLVGALGLVRYEGWVVVAAWAVWRRTPQAAVAAWGPLVWLAIKALGIHGYAASPTDFADWNGLVERFRFAAWWADVGNFGGRLWGSGGVVWFGLGAVALWLHRADPVARLVAFAAVAQLGITLAWIAGLEVATSRMVVVPVVVAAVLGASAVPWALRWRHAGWALLVVLVASVGVQLVEGRDRVRGEARHFRPEAEALEVMLAECPGCRWWVVPRAGLGSRARHDGCEVLQGISTLRAGREFECARWLDEAARPALEAATDGSVRWDADKKAYRVERHLSDAAILPD